MMISAFLEAREARLLKGVYLLILISAISCSSLGRDYAWQPASLAVCLASTGDFGSRAAAALI